MIKAIAFDLDGVLIDSKQLHFRAFNMAVAKVLGKQFCISREDHLRFYDGLPTLKKSMSCRTWRDSELIKQSVGKYGNVSRDLQMKESQVSGDLPH